jgi:hypothetical protein
VIIPRSGNVVHKFMHDILKTAFSSWETYLGIFLFSIVIVSMIYSRGLLDQAKSHVNALKHQNEAISKDLDKSKAKVKSLQREINNFNN